MIHGTLSIGWSRVEMTPPGRSLLQGQFYPRLSEGTTSPLFATALALEVRDEEGGSEQAILVSCDLTVIDFLDEVRRELEGSLPGFDLEATPEGRKAWERVIATPGITSWIIAAASFSIAALTGEKTDEIATERIPWSPIRPAMPLISAGSRGAMSRPSNS